MFRSGSARALLTALLLLALTCSSAFAVVYVKWDSPGPAFDGNSWETAYHTVQAGLNDADVTNEEVWVARGTYYERITLKGGVALYGGYAGEGMTRDIHAHETILDGGRNGSVVTSPAGLTATTRIDGFTIRNGSGEYGGGGIRCDSSSPTIANNKIIGNVTHSYMRGGGIQCNNCSPLIINNMITENRSEEEGGGIYCYNSSPTIINNTITRNTARLRGGGIRCSSASPIIANNTISGNYASSSGAISCVEGGKPVIINNIVKGNCAFNIGGIGCGSPATIANNTIIGNQSGTHNGAIYCTAAASVSNNIVAFNCSGICRPAGYAAPTLTNNCVYGNGGFDYIGISPGAGDMQIDPMLADATYSNVHIQPGSPCKDAGNDSIVQPAWLDLDGQPRIRNDHVDIGADESDGTSWPAGPYAVVRVSLSGSDANDGSSWALAKRTVQAAIDAASARGGEVWVKAGTYNECISLMPYAYMYGGFAGTENSRSERNLAANISALDGGGSGTVVTARTGYRTSAVDGFTITDGGGVSAGGGVLCEYSSLPICNNRIVGNHATYGGGIYCTNNSSHIMNNVIEGNSATYGGGINCIYNTPIIENNTIIGNAATTNGGGVFVNDSMPTIANNIVAFNSSGIYNTMDTPTLRNNDVYGNTTYDYSGISAGIGDISIDPLFVDRANGDYHLSPASLCIDTGLNDAPGLAALDIDGEHRVMNGIVDIGADEYPGALLPLAASTPVFSPHGGIYASPQTVTITCDTPGAVIRYTVTGIDPTEDDPIYTSPVLVDSDLTLKARAYADGRAPSPVKSAGFTVIPVSTPMFSPDGGIFSSAQTVTITCDMPGAVIHCTVTGIDPTESDPVYAGPVPIETDLTLKARAYKEGRAPSAVKSAGFTVIPAATPVFSPDGGIFPSAQAVTITCDTPGAAIHYTVTGIDPTENDPRYTGPVIVDRDLTLKARAFAADRAPSAVKSARYGFSMPRSVAEMKAQADETPVALNRTLISSAFSGYVYIQADDRSAGIRVDKASHTFTAGMRVNITGLIRTNIYGERYVSATTAVASAPPDNTGEVIPLLATNEYVAGDDWQYDPVTGAGQIGVEDSIDANTVGMLLTTTGRVTYSPTATYFVVWDGGKVNDQSGYRGIRVAVPAGVTKPEVGRYVKLTGVASIFKSGTGYFPVLRVRSQADIVVCE